MFKKRKKGSENTRPVMSTHHHYKIRCPHCLNEIPSNKVTFNLDGKIISQLESDLGITPAESRKGDNTKRNVEELLIIKQALELNTEVSKKYRITFAPEEVQLPMGYSDVKADQYPDIIKGSLFSKLVLEEQSEIMPWKEIYSCEKKVCPFCENNKALLKDSGKVPVYHITMIGPSTSGKTIMLVMQYLAASAALNRINMNTYNGIVNLQILDDEGIKNTDSIEKIANELTRNGVFPSSTETMLPPPHCIKVIYKQRTNALNDPVILYEPEPTKSAILIFQDIKGEKFTSTEQDERIKLTKICKNTDGVYLITDPCTLSACSNIINVNAAHTDMVVNDLFRLISYLSQNVEDVFNKVCACILSKTDLIYKYMDEINKNITSDYVLRKDNPSVDFESNFGYIDESCNWSAILDKIDVDTRNAIAALDTDGLWSGNVTVLFNTAHFFPVSSIGLGLQIIKVPYYMDQRPMIAVSNITNEPENAPSPEGGETFAPQENISDNSETFAPQESLSSEPPQKKFKNTGFVEYDDDDDDTKTYNGVNNPFHRDTAPRRPEPPKPERKIAYNKMMVDSNTADDFDGLPLEEKIQFGNNFNFGNINPYFHPRNIELPLLHMLMQFNIIPNLTSNEFREADAKLREDAFKNWLNKYGLHSLNINEPTSFEKFIQGLLDFFSKLFKK